jgi:cobalt-zinc-cadmium efflux system outer membrane protein
MVFPENGHAVRGTYRRSRWPHFTFRPSWTLPERNGEQPKQRFAQPDSARTPRSRSRPSTTPRPSRLRWIAAINLDLPVETAGKRGHRIAKARHLSDAAKFNIAAVAWRVRGKLRQTLVELHAATEQEQLLSAQQAAQEENVKLLEAQLAAGAVSAAEVTRERIALDTTMLMLQDAKRLRSESRVTLAEVIGVPARALDTVDISFAGLDRLPPDLDLQTARRQALLSRADILEALSEYAASEVALRMEIARQYPDIHLSPGYEYDQSDNKWGVGLAFELPSLNLNKGQIAEAEARRAERAARFNALQASVLAEIDRTFAAYSAATEKSAAAASLVANLEKQERLSRGRFEAGEVSRSEVIAAQVELAAARLACAAATAGAQQALTRLEEALQSPVMLPADPLQPPAMSGISQTRPAP